MALNPAFQPQVPGVLKLVELKTLSVTWSGALAPDINIFPPSTPFNVELELQLTESQAFLYAANTKLKFDAYAEMVGGGVGQTLVGSVTLGAPNQSNYTYDVTIPCAAIATPGAYILTVLLTSIDKGSSSPTWIAGFDEIMIQVAAGA